MLSEICSLKSISWEFNHQSLQRQCYITSNSSLFCLLLFPFLCYPSVSLTLSFLSVFLYFSTFFHSSSCCFQITRNSFFSLVNLNKFFQSNKKRRSNDFHMFFSLSLIPFTPLRENCPYTKNKTTPVHLLRKREQNMPFEKKQK